MAAIPFRHPFAVRRISMLQIDAVVSAKLGETRGRGRSQSLVFNRQVAMYLASRVGRWYTTAIGRFYNHRDHSPVCYSIQKTEKLRHENPEAAALLIDLEQTINEQHSRAQAEPNSMGSIGPVISESQIELVAKSAAELFYRDFKAALGRSLVQLQPGRSANVWLRRRFVLRTFTSNTEPCSSNGSQRMTNGREHTGQVPLTSSVTVSSREALDGKHRPPSVEEEEAAYAASSGSPSL